jgi:hypothetical protein
VTTDQARVLTPRILRLAWPIGLAALLGGYAALLGWDVFHYDWLLGFDAEGNWRYEEVLRQHHRLPTPADTHVWHTPPLFFAVAALIDSERGVQVFDAAASLVVVVLAGLIARELFPRSRAIQAGALGFAALAPVLTRTAIMYHPEPLATALATAGIFVVVRAITRGTLGVWTGACAGLLFGLATLTRTWALALVGASCLALLLHARWRRERATLLACAALVGVTAVISAPWFVHQARTYGNPLAFNRPAPDEPFFSRRPASFYTSLDVEEVFSRPYAPHFLNHLWPVIYSDWWGDYWRFFEVPRELVSTPPDLPAKYEAPRVRQSYVGIVPSLLAAFGFCALLVRGLRRRESALLAVLGAVLFLGLQFLLFQIAYPHADGDTIKAAYLLNAVAPTAVCAAWALACLRRAGRLATIAVFLLLAYLALLDVFFLVLPA